MRKPLVAVIGVLLAGICAWWLLLRSPSRATESGPVAKTEGKATSAPRGAEATNRDRGGDREMPSVLTDDDPKGALRLEGQVVDADDKPVAGATVVLASNPPRTTKSEDDGGFAFDGLVGRPYTLTARAAQG